MNIIAVFRKIKNGIKNEDFSKVPSNSIKILHLIRCEIADWNLIILLRRLFPAIEHLVLCENPIRKVYFDEKVGYSV